MNMSNLEVERGGGRGERKQEDEVRGERDMEGRGSRRECEGERRDRDAMNGELREKPRSSQVGHAWPFQCTV